MWLTLMHGVTQGIHSTGINHGSPPYVMITYSYSIKICEEKHRLSSWQWAECLVCRRVETTGPQWVTLTSLRYPLCQCEVRGERRWVGPLWVNYPWTSSKTLPHWDDINLWVSANVCVWIRSETPALAPSGGNHFFLPLLQSFARNQCASV